MCVPLLYIAEGSEDRSKACGTLHHVPCAALASATACGGGAASERYTRLGSVWMSRTVDYVTLQVPPRRATSHIVILIAYDIRDW